METNKQQQKKKTDKEKWLHTLNCIQKQDPKTDLREQ